MKLTNEQREICEKYHQPPYGSDPELKVGISQNVRSGLTPINGLRHRPKGDTSGWYIWAGEEMSDDPSFFLPIHEKHLNVWNPLISKYLGLPPGSRFLFTEDHEDVWFDASLLDV